MKDADMSQGIGVITCANQLGAHGNMIEVAHSINSSDLPILAIGLGAQSGFSKDIPQVHPGTLHWVKAIQSHAPVPGVPNISLRGEFTQRVMEHYGFGDAGVVLGCPSLFISPFKDLGQRIAARVSGRKRVAVLAGHPWDASLHTIERSLVDLVNQTKGAYILQGDKDMAGLARGDRAHLATESIRGWAKIMMPAATEEAVYEWWRQFAYVFFNVDGWLEFYKKFDFAIGCRIHGIIMALQAGIPAVCIAHDSRTLELCETMKIPHIRSDQLQGGVSYGALDYLFEKFYPEEFDNNRLSLWGRYLDFLDANQVDVNPEFRACYN